MTYVANGIAVTVPEPEVPKPQEEPMSTITYVRNADGSIKTRDGERVLAIGDLELTVSEARALKAKADRHDGAKLAATAVEFTEGVGYEGQPVAVEGAKAHTRALEILAEQGHAENYGTDDYVAAYERAEAELAGQDDLVVVPAVGSA